MSPGRRIPLRTSPVLAALLLFAAPALHAQTAPAMTAAAPQATMLTLAAEASAQGEPDVADIGAGVVTEASTASAALTANATQMTNVIAALKKAGIAERDIQTSGLSVQPKYTYRQNQAPLLAGFQASNQVRARIREPRDTGRVVDALVQAGANRIDGPSFAIDKPEPLLDKARAEAVAIGRARAELYARAAGMTVRRIVDIREASLPGIQPLPQPRMAMMAMEASADTPVAPGEVQLTARLQMTFELQ